MSMCTDTKLNTSTQHSTTLHNQIARRGWQLELFSLLLRTLFQEKIKIQFSFYCFAFYSWDQQSRMYIINYIFFRSTNVTNVNYVFSLGEYLNITVCVCTIMIWYQIRTYGMLKIQCTFVAKEC